MKSLNYLKIIFFVALILSIVSFAHAGQTRSTGSSTAPKAVKDNKLQSTLKPDIIVKIFSFKKPLSNKSEGVFKEGERITLAILFQNTGKALNSKKLQYSINCSTRSRGVQCPVKNETRTIDEEIEPGKTHQVLLPVTLKKEGEYNVTVKVARYIGFSQKSLKITVLPLKKRKFKGKAMTMGSSGTVTSKSHLGGLKFQTILNAKQFGEDFTKWVTEHTEDSAGVIRLRWKTLKDSNSKSFSGNWQISKSLNFNDIIKQGSAGIVPESGKGYQFFSIDFKKIVKSYPAPVTFYVRVVPATKSDMFTASLPVTVKITAPQEGTFFSSKGLYPELWNPVKVRVSLSNFRIIKSDEDIEEPYVVAVIVYADGTTVDLFNIGTSSVRISSTKKTHGNIKFNGYTKRLEINEGPWNTTVLPIGLNVLEWAEDVIKQKAPAKGLFLKNTFIAVFVAALEEDETATSDVNRLKNKLVSSLQKELDNAIRSIPFSIATAPKLQEEEAAEEFKETVMEEIETAIENVKKEMMRKFINIIKEKVYTFPLSIGQLVDPDNFVGVGYKIITLENLMNKGSIQIPMDFNSCGDCDAHYKLKVYIEKK
ncbi:MAG: hypothetical protein GY707_19760 [Desulfobacteraceae bacterium]|nr:hypothetical protein [Desulfobacteraceae bacterium]